MNIQGMSALVSGGGSGLAEASARELARLGAKVALLDLNFENAQKVAADIDGIAIQCDATHAASIFATPLMKTLLEPVQACLVAGIPLPSRLGKTAEFAQLATHIVSNGHLNGEVICLDGALRMALR